MFLHGYFISNLLLVIWIVKKVCNFDKSWFQNGSLKCYLIPYIGYHDFLRLLCVMCGSNSYVSNYLVYIDYSWRFWCEVKIIAITCTTCTFLQINASSTEDGLNFYDSGHRFEHSQLLLVLLRSLPSASKALQSRALQVCVSWNISRLSRNKCPCKGAWDILNPGLV